ncbi:MAG TPA: mannosyltransferase family protein [Myxococcales bacterium]
MIRQRWVERAERRPFLAILLLFVLTRCAVALALHAGAACMTDAKRAEWAWVPGRSDLFLGPAPPALLAPFVRWDANFYLALARHGYPPPREDRPVYQVAFFPLYPLAASVAEKLVGNVFWAALLVSNCFALAAALALFHLGKRNGSVRDGLGAATALLVAPGSHFLSLPYPEAMFVALLAWSLLELRKGRIWAAALAGALAGATRSAGVVVCAALLYVAWTRRSSLRRAGECLAAAAASLSGLAAFAAFCRARYGDAFAFVHIQSQYVNDRSIKLFGALGAFAAFDVDPDYYLVTLAALAVCVAMIKRAAVLDTLVAWFLLLLPLSTGTLKAMVRYQSANVTLLSGIVRLDIARRWPYALASSSAALLLLEAFLFGKGIGHY